MGGFSLANGKSGELRGRNKPKDIAMEFFEAASDWGQHRDVRVIFERDSVGDWFAHALFRDSRGDYRTYVPLTARRKGKKNGETEAEYAKRIADLMSKACVSAHRSRIGVAA